MADEVRFELRRGRGILLTLASAGMAALSVLLVSAAVAPHWLGGFTADNPVVWLVCLVGGTAGVLFFGFTTIAWPTVALRQDAGLVMDADGLTDRSSFISAGRITWDQVTGWHVWEMQRQKNLCLVVTDPESVLARMSPLARLLSRGNVSLVGTPVCIGLNNLTGSPDEIVAAAQERHDAWTRAHGA